MNFQGPLMDNQWGYGCPKCAPTCNQCYNVIQTCNVEEVPHYTNYHTHVVNNCVKRHVNIPTYSNDSETVVINEYVEGTPIYYGYQPNMANQPQVNVADSTTMPGYQGNVGVTPQGVANNMFTGPGFTNSGGFYPFGQ